MTTYVFENMSATDAADFTASDSLVFSTSTLQPSDVGVSNSGGLDITSLTAGGKTLDFGGSVLSHASTSDQISFTSSFIAGHQDSSLFVSDNAGTTINIVNDENGNIAYGFAGNDTINGGSGANDIFGGGGADSLTGGSGNDHIYGFQLSGGTSSDDGGDVITSGGGNDYINGMGGNDTIHGTGIGNDRIFGGSGDDTITLGTGNNTVNGNLGDDTINGGTGNDLLRGGQGDDSIIGGTGNDILMGDLGNDTLEAGSHINIMTGGDGADLFSFVTHHAAFTTGTDPLAYFTDTITDFAHGTDHIDLGIGIGLATADIIPEGAGVTLTTVSAAVTYAQQLLTNSGDPHGVVTVQVGSDAYLFYNSTGASETIDSGIKLSGVDATTITNTDFTHVSLVP